MLGAGCRWCRSQPVSDGLRLRSWRGCAWSVVGGCRQRPGYQWCSAVRRAERGIGVRSGVAVPGSPRRGRVGRWRVRSAAWSGRRGWTGGRRRGSAHRGAGPGRGGSTSNPSYPELDPLWPGRLSPARIRPYRRLPGGLDLLILLGVKVANSIMKSREGI